MRECSQELTQMPSGLSPLVNVMTDRLANDLDFDSNDETGDETVMSSSEDETSDEEISQPRNTKTKFQKVFGRPTDKKNQILCHLKN